MEPTIAEGFLFLYSAREIWDFAVEIYGEKKNITHIYQLQVDITKAPKGEKLFHAYLSQLKVMWEEL